MSPSSIKQKGNSWCLFFPLGTSHLNFKHLDSHYNIDNTANRKCELVWLVQSANVMLLAIILYSCDCSCILSTYIVSEMKNRDALRITRGYKEAYARPFVGPLVHCPRFFHILILTDCQQLKYISFRSRVSMNVCFYFTPLYIKEAPYWLALTPPSAPFPLVSRATLSGWRKRANHVRVKHLSLSLPPLIPPSPSFSLVSECGVCV